MDVDFDRDESERTGFTLLEMIVVLTIVGILAAVAVTASRDATLRAKEAVLREDLQRMREAIDEYRHETGGYPVTLEDLVAGGYLSAVPIDPITESAATWQIEPVDWQTPGQAAPSGIWDVRSGAEGVGLDGIPYGTW